jgi:hypothetical protein
MPFPLATMPLPEQILARHHFDPANDPEKKYEQFWSMLVTGMYSLIIASWRKIDAGFTYRQDPNQLRHF